MSDIREFDQFMERDIVNSAPAERYRFPNGFGASVVHHHYAYGGYELAVIKWENDKNWGITYDTPITDDVIGHLNDESCAELLERIQAL